MKSKLLTDLKKMNNSKNTCLPAKRKLDIVYAAMLNLCDFDLFTRNGMQTCMKKPL